MMRFAVLAFTLATVTPACAQQPSVALPHYDTAAVCKKQGGENLPVRTLNACVENEQLAYDHLRLEWDDADDTIRRDCVDFIQRSTPATPKYGVLNTCVSARLEAQYREQEAPEPFHY